MNYIIKKSKRKTMSIEITDNCEVLVKAPFFVKNSEIEKFVSSHTKWINEKTELKKEKNRLFSVSEDEKKELKKNAKDYLIKRVEYFSDLMGLYPEKITITSAKKRFGSCSGKNTICFSFYLMKYPKEAIDYVVVHELAHIKHHNHSKNFYNLIERYLPDYKEREKMLKKA